MKARELEPGTLYLGPKGQVRELVEVDAKEVVYRQINRGTVKNGMIPQVGEVRRQVIHQFAFWALAEVAA